MKFIDTHCHIDFPEFDDDREAVVSLSARLGVSVMVVPGVKASAWPQLLKICGQYPGLRPALGLHPMFVAEHIERDLEVLEASLERRQDVVAVGEIGLDNYAPDLDKIAQQKYFDAQLSIAHNMKRPVILHVRKAHEQVLYALKHKSVVGGVVHAFNGSLEQAKRYMSHGFKFGFGGMVTNEKSAKLRALVQALPLSHMVMETDAPDMAGIAYRGERNSPVYLPEYFNALAELRDEAPEEIAAAMYENSCKVFGLN